jgi:negative regulator of flagellin synthesis FlgM
MSQKIENLGTQVAVQPLRVRSTDGNAGSGKPAAAVAPADSVKLSGAALQRQQLEKAVADAPAVDIKKVADLREKIRDGSYRANPQVIADKLSHLDWQLTGT